MDENYQTAYLSLGCFWEPDDQLPKLTGVISTEVGYSGGKQDNPSYDNIGDHTETIKVIFDPSQISYVDLLQSFWDMHDPTAKQKRQYQSIIFYTSPDQKREAEMTWLQEQEHHTSPILTKIIPFEKFWRAEEYHQKYLAKQRN